MNWRMIANGTRHSRGCRNNSAVWQTVSAKTFAPDGCNPSHPGVHFKRVHFKRVHDREPICSARVGLGWRVLGLLEGDTVTWFWIGSHAEYGIGGGVRVAADAAGARDLGELVAAHGFPFLPVPLGEDARRDVGALEGLATALAVVGVHDAALSGAGKPMRD
jgi:hypothetical protein